MTESEQLQKHRTLTKIEIDNILIAPVGVPIRYQQAKKEDIEAKIWALTDEFRQKKREGLFIFGDAGTGKTYLAIALLRQWFLTLKIIGDEPIFSSIKFISVQIGRASCRERV